MRFWLEAAVAASAVLCAAFMCGDESGRQASRSLSRSAATPTVDSAPSPSYLPPPPRRDDCLAEIDRLRELPALPGAPGFERNRAHVLARAKAEPVLFLTAPRYREVADAEVRHYRATLRQARTPGYTLARSYGKLRRRPEVAREVLLRDGYLYAESAHLAAVLVETVALHHMFRAPALVIQRGARRMRVVKGKRFYEHGAGPQQGQRARMLLLDRVWPAGQDPGPPLHLGLRSLRRSSGADRIRVEHLTAEGIVAKLRYGSHWVPSVLGTEGARATLRCEAVAAGQEAAVAFARELMQRRRRVLEAERAAIHRQVEEVLPFDEPRTEAGQQDGNLRPAWAWAYEHGWLTYEFNEDKYDVFDRWGRPLPPQVCIDFVMDTLERASGTWWPKRGQDSPGRLMARQRVRGNLDFRQLGLGNRRSVDAFVDFAWDHPQWFDAHDLVATERIPFFRRRRFFDHIYQHRDRYLPGDIVTIHGRRDDDELHYHSFFIYDSDPLSGMPTLLASNAGRPRIRNWEQEMRNAPLRSIRSRIRPRLSWLEPLVVLQDEVVANEPTQPSARSG